MVCYVNIYKALIKESVLSTGCSIESLYLIVIYIIFMLHMFPEDLSVLCHPRDKVRVIGESVTFFCSTSGMPTVDYFEW